MPLNVRELFASVLLVFTISILCSAQTSGDIMRERVAKAKAFIAIRNYNAAIYELENIRRETSDPTVNSVINVLLINSFLEQGDYKRAQDFLGDLTKSNKPNASANYLAAAGQVVKGTRSQMERYRALGLSISDRNLPKDAVNDVDKMRETLEKIVEQTKVLSKDKTQTSNAMALMEEATNARGNLARDTFDANRWKNETADAREDLASSRSVVTNAVSETPPVVVLPNTVASSSPPTNTLKISDTVPIIKTASMSVEKTDAPKIEQTNKQVVAENARSEEAEKPINTPPVETSSASVLPTRTLRVALPKQEEPKVENKAEIKAVPPEIVETKILSPMAVGSLVEHATQKANPVYPPMAKNMRLSGVVKVNLVIDEKGQVAEVKDSSGPEMLQRAATDAIKKWKFKPFKRDGQAIKATGFVSFNFSL